ncbi:MAG: AEC family transporter [Lachnospiraceae bacterium]|nr:AEC family transporter [Lachnospiraceae bacterium]
MENVYLGIRVVFPLLCFMLVGYLSRRIKWMDAASLHRLNTLVFRLLMPLLVFINGSTVDIQAVFNAENIRVLLLALPGIGIILTLSLLVCKPLISDIKTRAIIIQGVYRSNLILFGLPVILTIYGGYQVGTLSVLIIFIVPLYNIIAAFLLGNAIQKEKRIGFLFQQALTNPLVIAAISGLVYNVIFRGFMPELFLDPLQQLGRVATPLAFIVLGGSLKFTRLVKETKYLVIVCLLRLVVIPGIMLAIAVLIMGITGPALVVLTAAFASPVAISSYTMARNMNVAPNLAGDLVAVSTVVSMFTIAAWVAFLGFQGLL